ncbi:hypothetical protein [Bradyrhizobium oropedii]|uniref:hypothetical protein n=1 Tax=Bradyrhizobium oropedii TaxID=1571201 RepID=UPI001E476FF1|nr:hypothetical protein [Bradyrhizobium oropedii]
MCISSISPRRRWSASPRPACALRRDYDFDIIVYATGFDAITGAYDLIDISGIGGERLADKWKQAPSTFLGMLVHGFPNLLMPTGPQSASASTNFPRGIENGVNWCSHLLQYMWARGLTRADATLEAQQRWTARMSSRCTRSC